MRVNRGSYGVPVLWLIHASAVFWMHIRSTASFSNFGDTCPSFSKIGTLSPAFGETSVVSPIGETRERERLESWPAHFGKYLAVGEAFLYYPYSYSLHIDRNFQ
jgi:hypothetical protein